MDGWMDGWKLNWVQWCQGGKVRASVGLSAVGHKTTWGCLWPSDLEAHPEGKGLQLWQGRLKLKSVHLGNSQSLNCPIPKVLGEVLEDVMGKGFPRDPDEGKGGLQVWKALRENFLVIVAVTKIKCSYLGRAFLVAHWSASARFDPCRFWDLESSQESYCVGEPSKNQRSGEQSQKHFSWETGNQLASS